MRSLRFDFSFNPSDRFSVNISYDLIPKIEDKKGLPFTANILNYTNSYRAYDLNKILLLSGYDESSGGNFAVYQNLDRAYLRLRFDFADIYRKTGCIMGKRKTCQSDGYIRPFLF